MLLANTSHGDMLLVQDVLATLKECIKKNSQAPVSAEDETMLAYVSAQAARLIDVKIFNPSEWSKKVCFNILVTLSCGLQSVLQITYNTFRNSICICKC